MRKHAILKIAMCTVTAVLLAVSVSAYLDRVTGTVNGYATEGLIYDGLNGGYHASTYVNPSANYETVWAKVELVTSGNIRHWRNLAPAIQQILNDITTTKYVASVRGYHYVETENGGTWGSRDEYLTNYLTPGR